MQGKSTTYAALYGNGDLVYRNRVQGSGTHHSSETPTSFPQIVRWVCPDYYIPPTVLVMEEGLVA